MNCKSVIGHIVQWLSQYTKTAGTSGFVVGVSGGIDSAVTSSLAARTGHSVLCLEMPIHQAPSHVSRARQHIDQLQAEFSNVDRLTIDLTPTFDIFNAALPAVDDEELRFLAIANSRARLRMTSLYHCAGINGYLVAGTGNKVEDFGVGFFTKYGDGGVDLSPIADLMKSEVYALAREMQIIDDILRATPTDGLWSDDRSDEDQIGASYPELEWAMEFGPHQSKDELTQRQLEVLAIYDKLNRANKHKMEPIPVCTVPHSIKNS